MRVLFLLSSERLHGNAERLAREAAKALPEHAEQVWIRHADHRLPPFEDRRHVTDDQPGYAEPEGAAALLARETLAATDIVFVAPVYWYNLPAAAKLYLDHWSGWMRVESLHFKATMRGKRLRLITVLSDDDRTLAEPSIRTLELSARYLDMQWSGALIGYGNRPGDVRLDEAVTTDIRRFW